MLAIIIVGLLIMTRAISLEELANGIWRGFLMTLSVSIALCVLKGLLLPILASWLVALKQMIWWIVIFVLAVMAAMLVLRVLVSKLEKCGSARANHDGGEL
jgi:hypothetical protein